MPNTKAQDSLATADVSGAQKNLSAREVLLFVSFLHQAHVASCADSRVEAGVWLKAASFICSVEAAECAALVGFLLAQQRTDEGLAVARAFALLKVRDADALFQLGYALQMAGRHAEAVEPYREAFILQPDMPSLRNNLAMALKLSGDTSSVSLGLLRDAVASRPEELDAWINLMIVSLDGWDIDGALHALERAVALGPNSFMALNNAAAVCKEAQCWDEAERLAEKACALEPLKPSGRFNLALIQLVRGKAAGWEGHELRWEGSHELAGRLPVFAGPRWRGESLAGKTLLVWGEQGMGDLLQFCRFIPAMAAHVHRNGGRIVWNAFPQMGKLLDRSLAHVVDEYTAVRTPAELPRFDYEFPCMSIPHTLGLEDMVDAYSAPYLRADAQGGEAWRKRLSMEAGGSLKVGLVWTGSVTHRRNAFRAVDLSRYEACFAGLDDVQFYSLQTGASEEVAAARSRGFNIIDHTDSCRSFDDTASLIGALDLVISVCTSVAHLSGALGQHTWVLLDVNPHWPWLLERTDSPWYPTATLYRQREFGNWGSVLADVRRDLQKFCESAGPRSDCFYGRLWGAGFANMRTLKKL